MADKFFTIIVAVIILSVVCAVTVFAVMQNNVCQQVCGSDPVARCYKDRALCVGTDKVYVKQIP